MNEYIVTCLTYKRKQPKIFEMLKSDAKINIWFGVRREELESGYYDDWKSLPFADRIHFIPLDDVVDAGDTRQKILDWCYVQGYKYVVQFDDTVRKIKNTQHDTWTTTTCIKYALAQMKDDPLNPIGFEFVRRNMKIRKTRKAYIQAWIIDVQRLHDAGINFRTVKETGWDDFTFSWEVHNAGFYTITDPTLVRVAKSSYPWANEAGGTHVGEDMTVQAMIDKNNAKCAQCKAFLETKFGANNVSILKLQPRNKSKLSFDYLRATWED